MSKDKVKEKNIEEDLFITIPRVGEKILLLQKLDGMNKGSVCTVVGWNPIYMNYMVIEEVKNSKRKYKFIDRSNPGFRPYQLLSTIMVAVEKVGVRGKNRFMLSNIQIPIFYGDLINDIRNVDVKNNAINTIESMTGVDSSKPVIETVSTREVSEELTPENILKRYVMRRTLASKVYDSVKRPNKRRILFNNDITINLGNYSSFGDRSFFHTLNNDCMRFESWECVKNNLLDLSQQLSSNEHLKSIISSIEVGYSRIMAVYVLKVLCNVVFANKSIVDYCKYLFRTKALTRRTKAGKRVDNFVNDYSDEMELKSGIAVSNEYNRLLSNRSVSEPGSAFIKELFKTIY